MENKYKACETHCCIIHGCKYGHKNCPVVLGKIKQKYMCEYCSDVLSYGFRGYRYTESEWKIFIDKEFIKENRKIKLKTLNNDGK